MFRWDSDTGLVKIYNMKTIHLLILIILFSTSCEKINLKNELKSQDEIQLNNIQKVTILKDDGLLIAGEYDSKTTIIRTDANFRTLWRKGNYEWGTNIHGSWGQSSYSVSIINMFQNEFNNFICIASVMEGGCVMYSSTLIFELNNEGEQLKKIELKDFSANEAIRTVDGGYLLSGSKILKLDKNFKSEWEKDYYGAENLWTGKIINTNDGKYALTAWNGDKSYFRILDLNGNLIESEEYSFNEIPFDETGNDLIQLKDNGFIIVGRTRNLSEPWYMDCGAIRINSSGEKIWSEKFGSSDDDWLENVIYSSEDELIVQGKIGFPNDPVQKTILYKITPDGQISDSCKVDRMETLLYDSHDYFIKTIKLDDNYYRLTKIPFSEILNIDKYPIFD